MLDSLAVAGAAVEATTDVGVIGAAGSPFQDPALDRPQLARRLDWYAVFARDNNIDWLVEDVWPAGRQLHNFAAKKSGKSLVMLWIAGAWPPPATRSPGENDPAPASPTWTTR